MKSALLSLSIVLLPFPLLAQAPPKVHEAIVVTASSVPESAESTPSSVTVIDREEIERRDARQVADALREVPGLIVSRTGSRGKITSLFTRGGGSTQTLVLWNGVRLNNPYFSGYNWGQFSTAGVDRIEVVSGPFSALYGSEAVSGVVNILTNPSASFLAADAEAGENGLANGSVSGAYHDGALSLSGAVDRQQDDGFAPNDDYRQDSASAGLTFAPAAHWSIGADARYARYELGVPRNVGPDFTTFVPSPHRRESGHEMQASVPVSWDDGRTRYEVRLTQNSRDDHYEDPDAAFDRSARTESDSRRAGASARFTTGLGRITVGGEYVSDSATHFDAFGSNIDDRSRTSRSLFVEDRASHRAGRGTVEIAAGLRWDDFDTFGRELSPRVAAAWVVDGHKVRAAVGRAFRAPSIGELYIPFFGNPDLEAERGRSYEVGYDRFFARGHVSATAFRNDFDNLIVYDGLSQRFGNVGAAKSDGVELGAAAPVTSRLALGVTYTYLHTEQEETGEALLRRPRHSGSLSVGYDVAALRTQLVVVYNGQRDDVTDLVPFGRVSNASYTTADLVVHYDLRGGITPFVKVSNLTDEKYEEVFGYPSPRRRVAVGVRYASKAR